MRVKQKVNVDVDLNVSVKDKWAQQCTQIENLAAQQVAADIDFVEAQRNLRKAQLWFDASSRARTAAEKALNTARAKLGAE